MRIGLNTSGVHVVTIAPLQVGFDPTVLDFNSCESLVPEKDTFATVVSPGLLSVGVYGGLSLFPRGDFLECRFAIAARAAPGPSTLMFLLANLSDDQFNDVSAVGTDGAVTVESGTSKPCVGDCSHILQVTVAELITMVDIALGDTDVSACAAGDENGDGSITVNEIIAGVNNALNGCPEVVGQ